MKQSRVKKTELPLRKRNLPYVTPRPKDVKCGQGSINFQHPGNQRLRALIAPEVDSYDACTERREKTFVIREVIEVVFNEGGRFLKYEKKTRKWYDGGLQTAKNRVGTAFRDAVALKRKNALASGFTEETKGSAANTTQQKVSGKSKVRVDVPDKHISCDNHPEEQDCNINKDSNRAKNKQQDLVAANKPNPQDQAHQQQRLSPSCSTITAKDVPWWLSSRSMLQLWTSVPQQPHVIFVNPTRNQQLPGFITAAHHMYAEYESQPMVLDCCEDY